MTNLECVGHLGSLGVTKVQTKSIFLKVIQQISNRHLPTMYQLTAEEECNRLFSILTKLTFQWGKLSYLRRVVREVLCVETIFELVHESCGQRMFDEKNRDYEFRTQKCFGASPGPMGSRQKAGYFSMCDGKPVERNVMIFFSLR